jgi:hypothetical protein
VAPGVQQLEADVDRLRGKLKGQIEQLFATGYWFCQSCNAPTERIEDDHGQPAHCERCRSPRIYFVQPIHKQEGK